MASLGLGESQLYSSLQNLSGLSGGLGGGFALIAKVINVLLSAGAVLAVLAIIYSGIVIISSFGDTEKIQTAKKNLIYVSIALAVLVLAIPIVNLLIIFISRALTGGKVG